MLKLSLGLSKSTYNLRVGVRFVLEFQCIMKYLKSSGRKLNWSLKCRHELLQFINKLKNICRA